MSLSGTLSAELINIVIRMYMQFLSYHNMLMTACLSSFLLFYTRVQTDAQLMMRRTN